MIDVANVAKRFEITKITFQCMMQICIIFAKFVVLSPRKNHNYEKQNRNIPFVAVVSDACMYEVIEIPSSGRLICRLEDDSSITVYIKQLCCENVHG